MKKKANAWGAVPLLLLSLSGLGHAVQPRGAEGGPSTRPVGVRQAGEAGPPAARDDPPNAWRGLIPLRSTRADVERVLGKAKKARGLTSVYQTEGETVDVLYAAGPCQLSAVERWNVPADVVIRIDVRPRTEIPVQALRLDSARYPRLREAHPDNWARYMNVEDGVMVETITYDKSEEVYTITYWPRAKDKSLRCP